MRTQISLVFITFVFFGCAPCRFAQTPLHTIYGQTWPNGVAETFGLTVIGLGDIDNDGIADFAAGAQNASPNNTQSGAVRVFSGATGTLIRVHDGQQNGSLLGFGLGNAGDVDGDSIDDIIAGAPLVLPPLPFGPPNPPGRAFIYSGSTGSLIWIVQAATIADSFGRAVAGLGDVNFDGRADFAVGAPTANYVQVFSGLTGLLLYQLNGDSPFDQFGTSIIAVGDQDGDGAGDFAVGAPSDDNTATDAGMVRVFSGNTGAVLLSVDGAAAGDGLGRTLGQVGDLNGDNLPELLLGAPLADIPTMDTGYVQILSIPTATVLAVLSGSNTSDFFGRSLSGVGDLDHDGSNEIAVTASGFDLPGLSNAGRVTIYSGASFQAMTTFDGTGASDGTASWIAALGDVNGDLYDDVLIGSGLVDFSGNTNIGRIDVVSFGARLSTCGRGDVFTLGGTLVDTLFVNGSSGLSPRRVDVPMNTSITVSMTQPPAHVLPAAFLLFGCIDVPSAADRTLLPFGLSDMCFPPNLLSPADPRLFMLANSFVPVDPSALVPTSTPAPFSISSPGLPIPFRLTMQGIIADSPGPLSVTNGVILNIF